MSSPLQQIVDYLSINGRGTTAQFKFELGLTEATVAQTLAHLQSTGRIAPLQARGAIPLSGFEAAEDRPLASSKAPAACGGSCNCGGPAAGPELTIWVKRQR